MPSRKQLNFVWRTTPKKFSRFTISDKLTNKRNFRRRFARKKIRQIPKRKKRKLHASWILVDKKRADNWKKKLFSITHPFILRQRAYNRAAVRNIVLCAKLDFFGSTVTRYEPIPVTSRTIWMFSTKLPELLSEYDRLFSYFVGRRTAFYLPITINYFEPFEVLQGEQKKKFKFCVYRGPRSTYNFEFLQRTKHRFFRSLFSSLFLRNKGKISTYRRLKFRSRNGGALYLKSSFFEKYVRGSELPIVFTNLEETPAKNAGVYNNLVEVSGRISLIQELLKKFLIFHLKSFLLKALLFKITAKHEPVVVLLTKRLKILGLQIFKLCRLETSFLEASTRFLNWWQQNPERSAVALEVISSNPNIIFLNMKRDITEYYKAFVQQITELTPLRNFIFLPKDTADPGSYTLGYRFLRRVNFLLTKKGNRLGAFKTLVQLIKLTSCKRLRSRGYLKNRILSDPFARIVSNLKTYFFIRKFTKGRKTMMIPGILFRRKKLRLAARWFLAPVRKKKLGRPLIEKLLENTRSVFYGQGLSQELQKSYNALVKDSVINILPKRGARRFKLPKEREKKVGLNEKTPFKRKYHKKKLIIKKGVS